MECRRWRNTSSVGDMFDQLQWPKFVIVYGLIHGGSTSCLLALSDSRFDPFALFHHR